MRNLMGTALAVLLIASAHVVMPGVAQASPDLTGRWATDSLRDNRIGYFLVLRPGPSTSQPYVGYLRFEYQDGRRNAKMPVTARVVGEDVIIATRSGTFDKSGRALRADFNPRTMSLTLTNCTARLRLVMPWALESDCVLRLQG
ncbi:MAG: hypothetical protein NWQ12_05295 [Candidatus Nanopelagicales bacterium]|nr:hypothetical protein [Candidatus Nanopelagicales bacterium]